MYDVKSPKAEEFISHEEILDTLKYAEENKHNAELIDQILANAHRYAFKTRGCSDSYIDSKNWRSKCHSSEDSPEINRRRTRSIYVSNI